MATDNVVRVMLEAYIDDFKMRIHEAADSVTGLGGAGKKAGKDLEFKDSKNNVTAITEKVKDAAANTKELGDKANEAGNKMKQGFKAAESGAEKLYSTINNIIKVLVTGYVANQIKRFFGTAVGEIGKTQTALGELKSVGVEDLETLRQAAIRFSNTWSGTTRVEFLNASNAIKSGVASLSDEGVATFTELAALTAKATQSAASEMTNLYAQGYGIYRKQFGSDNEFAESFSGGIARAADLYRTDGAEMSRFLSSLGASAEKAGRPLSEILAIGGELQATMKGSEAATQFSAFLRSVTKAGEKLGLSFVDANNRLKSIPEIIDVIRKKYGNTLDALETWELTEAFGTKEAVDMINLLYEKTSDVVEKTGELEHAMKQGSLVAKEMAEAMNEGITEKANLLKQKVSNIFEEIGNKIKTHLSGVYGSVFNAIDSFVANGSLDRMADSIARIIELFANWFNNFLQKAPSMLEKLADGLSWVADNIYGIAKALAIVSSLAAVPKILGGVGLIVGGISQITTGVGIATGIASIIKGVGLLGSGIAVAGISLTALNQINKSEKESKIVRNNDQVTNTLKNNESDTNSSSNNSTFNSLEKTAAGSIDSTNDKRSVFEKALDNIFNSFKTREELINSQIELEDAKGNEKGKKSFQQTYADTLNEKLVSMLKLDRLAANGDEKNILETTRNRILTEIARITSDIKSGMDELIGSFNTPSEFSALTEYAYNTNNSNNSILTRIISMPNVNFYMTVKDLGSDGAAKAKDMLNNFAGAFLSKDNIVFDGMGDVVKN